MHQRSPVPAWRCRRWICAPAAGAALLLAGVLLIGPADPPNGLPNAAAAAPERAAQDAGDSDRRISYQDDVRELLSIYCFDCHGGAKTEADLSLKRFESESDIAAAPETWLSVLKMLEDRTMPPAEEVQPYPEERELLVQWIDDKLTEVICSGPTDPGRSTIRRLNRREYRNTIRDLVGVDYEPAEDFPGDDSGYGYDNIGDVLSVSSLLLEKYLKAAREITERAIASEDPVRTHRFGAGRLEGNNGREKLTSTGERYAEHEIEHAGRYRLRVWAAGDQAGDEPAKIAIRVDGERVTVHDVPATRDEPGVYETDLELEPGQRRIAARFINDYYRPDAGEDRNLMVLRFELRGPIGRRRELLPESHKQLIFIEPNDEGEPSHREAARRVLNRFTRRAYRRPLQEGELDRIMKLYTMVREKDESFERGIQVAMQGVLVSPHFLFRVLRDREPEDPQQPRAGWPLSDHELATRLSYFLWGTMPDDQLRNLADRGVLRKGDHLPEQVRRMLRSEKAANGLIEGFADQWLQTRNLASAEPDTERFPGFDASLREAMRKETLLLFEAVMRDDLSVLELIDADFTHLNEELAKHYGIEGVSGSEFRRVELNDRRRGGIITQASILTLTSNPTRTSPVKRGKWVLKQLLGSPPPEPPADVPGLADSEEAGTVDPDAPLRKRLEQHRADPSCSVCHRRMDAMGFALENFNAVGAWRETDGEHPIDASGELPGGETFEGPTGLKKVLLSQKHQFVENLARQLLTYALGRGLHYFDRCAVDRIVRRVERSDYHFSALVLGIVESAPFQRRRAPLSEIRGE